MTTHKFGQPESEGQENALAGVNWMADQMVVFSQKLIQAMLAEYPEGSEEGDILRLNLTLLRGTILVSSRDVGAIRSLGYEDTPEGVREHAQDITEALDVVLKSIGGELQLVELHDPPSSDGPLMN